MATEAKSTEKSQEPVKPRLISVSLTRPVSLAGTPSQHFAASKYRIEVDSDGDLTIRDSRGNFLFVPKQLAILEYALR